MKSSKQAKSKQSKAIRHEILSLISGFKEAITVSDQGQQHRNGVPGFTEGLTLRETEVLRLVVRGRNNSEIARELFISLNTVTRHMTNIFSKTGTSNRVEVAVYAARYGIM